MIQFFLVVLMAFAASGLLIGVLALLGYALDPRITIPGGGGMVRGETPRPGGHETPLPPGAT